MERDEEGTHRRLSAALDAIADTVKGSRGSVVHYAGDAVLAEFPSARDAVESAVAAQHALAKLNENLSDVEQVRFRMGVNLGDVIIDRDDIYGDGVNIAARLETIADPGGICISGSVHDALGARLNVPAHFLGEQQVKNIQQPVRVYALDIGTGVRRPFDTAPSRRTNRSWWLAVAGVACVVVLGAAFTTDWFGAALDGNAARALKSAVGAASTTPAVPAEPMRRDAPVIAVLPFSNLGDDPNQDYFSDGLTEDLTTDLSRISGLQVIARNPTFVYKGRAVNITSIAQELNAAFVLEASVRRAAGTVRINAQLIDGASGTHVWAERYDGKLDDVFALQEQVTRKLRQSFGRQADTHGKGAPRKYPQS